MKKFLIFLSILLFLTGTYFLLLNFTKKVPNYSIKRDLDYQVYLKENPFYDEKYLTKSDAYPVIYINYINLSNITKL